MDWMTSPLCWYFRGTEKEKQKRRGEVFFFFSNFAVPLCHTLGNPSSSQLQTPSWRLPGVFVRARTSLKKRRVVLWQHKSILISDSEIDYPSSPCLMHPFLRPPPPFWSSLNFTILGGRASGGGKRTEEIKKLRRRLPYIMHWHGVEFPYFGLRWSLSYGWKAYLVKTASCTATPAIYVTCGEKIRNSTSVSNWEAKVLTCFELCFVRRM
jgi:hypothetical protein